MPAYRCRSGAAQAKQKPQAAHLTNRPKTRQKTETRHHLLSPTAPPYLSRGGRRSPAPSAGAATAAEAPSYPAPQRRPLSALPIAGGTIKWPLELPRAACRGLWLAEGGEEERCRVRPSEPLGEDGSLRTSAGRWERSGCGGKPVVGWARGGRRAGPLLWSWGPPSGASELAGSGTAESGTPPVAAALQAYLCRVPAPLWNRGTC